MDSTSFVHCAFVKQSMHSFVCSPFQHSAEVANISPAVL